MFSVCFQPYQGLIADTKTKEMNIHSSLARPKTKTSDQLVSIADYMGTSLEANDNHTISLVQQSTCAIINCQAYNKTNI